MNEPLDELYFNWLCAKVLTLDYPIYNDLMGILYKTEFIWIIDGDRNRAEDGVELREDFLRETGYENDPDWFTYPCSILEAFIALSKRASFQTDISVHDWFWMMMTNLNLDDYRRVSQSDKSRIDDVLQTFVWRTYSPNGHGGLFPMRRATRDQRKTELWYQCCDWLEEQGFI